MGNDVYVGDQRVRHPRAAERVLQHRLLLQHARLGHREVLLVARHFGFGAHDLDRRECSDLHLLLVVAEQLLGQRQGLLLHLRILVEAHQIPINIDDIGNRCDHLLLEYQIAHRNFILRDPNIAVIDGQTESAQQILADREYPRWCRTG